MDFPEQVLRRVILYAAVSNVELAKVSNVSSVWREVVKKVVLEQALQSKASPTDPPLLLLPSMVRHLVLIQGDQRSTSKAEKLYCDETFCAAWFHPDGIQEKIFLTEQQAQAQRDEMLDDVGTNSAQSPAHTSLSEPFAPNGEQTYEASDTEQSKLRNNRNTARSKSPSCTSPSMNRSPPRVDETGKEYVSCAYEWRGLREPFQVLCNFGYTKSFVDGLLQTVTESMETDSMDTDSSYADQLLLESPLHQATFAVRGATVARPESYCLCLDGAEENLEEMKARAIADGASEELLGIRIREYKESWARRQQRKRELMRDVLPRILMRTPVASSAASKMDDPGSGSVPVPSYTTIGREQRSIQFLNADGSHAVCMMTPHFACGPLTEPVTILCVGIATEDGCFLSGLHHRFELGHMYPNGAVEEVTELSPVCIATDTWQVEEKPLIPNNDDDGPAFHLSSSGDDSSYDFSEEEGSSSFKCECIFNGVGDKVEEIDDDENRKVHRGKRGPGAWHCYVAVFDDESSLVRIDGLTEPLQAGDLMQGAHPGMLDGLTIGSDHCFGMSLCCGHGSGGEGEGAIAELAVFRGRLDISDIEVLERQMMQRHGIPSSQDATPETVWQENTWERQAQALFWQTSDHDWNFEHRVPLRMMARHRSVAWKQSSPVTGKEVRIQKIGCRPGASSSDW
jgi:hypothetical protein